MQAALLLTSTKIKIPSSISVVVKPLPAYLNNYDVHSYGICSIRPRR